MKPRSVKVGAQTYCIQYRPLTDLMGECLTRSKIIRVNKHLAGRVMAETILHETMHAIWYEWGIKNSEMSESDFVAGVATEEHAINGLANGIMAVFRDNPKFRAFIVKASK